MAGPLKNRSRRALSQAQSTTMPLPMRHTTAEPITTRQSMHLPPELLEKIAFHAGAPHELANVCKLRLVCRSFADGLLPCIARDRVLDIYLDKEGMEDFESLANTRMAKFVRRVVVGIRQFSNEVLVFEQDPAVFYRFFGSQVHEQRELATEFSKLVLDSSYDAKLVMTLCAEVQEFGFSTKKERMGCEMFQLEQDFTPMHEILRRFVKALAGFPSIESLQSRDVSDHCIIVVKDESGEIIARRLAKLQRAGPLQPHRSIDCTVTAACRPRVPCESSMSTESPLFYDLGRLHPLLPVGASIFANLKELCLRVPGPLPENPSSYMTRASSTAGYEIGLMLLKCINLVKLQLSTRHSERDLIGMERHVRTKAINTILRVMTSGQWQGRLKILSLSCVNPTDYDVVSFLKSQTALEYLEIPEKHSSGPAEMVTLWETLQTMPKLSLCLKDFSYMPNTRFGVKIESVVGMSDLPVFLEIAIVLVERSMIQV